MRQDRKKMADDDTHSVLSEARSQRSMVIDGSSVQFVSYDLWPPLVKHQIFSENVIEEVSVAEDPLLMFMKIIQVTLLGQILEIVCRNRLNADKKSYKSGPLRY